MSILEILTVAFSVLGAVDYIFGSKLGLGKQFERGLMLSGTMLLTMLGMISIAPVLAQLLKPLFDGFYGLLGIDPSILPATIFANDMGGASVAGEIARDELLGGFNGLVVASMMGATISFTLPLAMNTVEKKHHDSMILGFLCGILTIPVGCFVAGLMCKISVPVLLYDLLPLLVVSVVIALGLIFFRRQSIAVLKALAMGIRVLIVAGLALSIFTFLTGKELIAGMAPFEEGAMICVRSAVVMSGTFPMIFLVSKLLEKPLKKLGKLAGINEASALGFVATLATNVNTFERMKDMDSRGQVLNAAFAISAAFIFGGQLAFTMAYCDEYVVPMMVGKLVAGLTAVAVAALALRMSKPKTEISK